MIVTYKYYDDRKRRLAILAKPIAEDKAAVYVLTCSKKDFFCKSKARKALVDFSEKQKGFIDGNEIHPFSTVLDVETNWKGSVIEWADDKFYRVVRMYCRYTETILSGKKDSKILGRTRSYLKL